MRGTDEQQGWMFSYISAEKRVPQDHPLRAIRTMADIILKELSLRFESLYSQTGRPSIAPEKLLRALLRALLPQVLHSVWSERLLMEQLDYNLLFRWFVKSKRVGRHCASDEGDRDSRKRSRNPDA